MTDPIWGPLHPELAILQTKIFFSIQGADAALVEHTGYISVALEIEKFGRFFCRYAICELVRFSLEMPESLRSLRQKLYRMRIGCFFSRKRMRWKIGYPVTKRTVMLLSVFIMVSFHWINPHRLNPTTDGSLSEATAQQQLWPPLFARRACHSCEFVGCIIFWLCLLHGWVFSRF